MMINSKMYELTKTCGFVMSNWAQVPGRCGEMCYRSATAVIAIAVIPVVGLPIILIDSPNSLPVCRKEGQTSA